MRAAMPHVPHKKAARIGERLAPASSPMLIQPMVRARLRLSKLETSAISEPHAGRKAALPMSSAAFATAIPANVGNNR